MADDIRFDIILDDAKAQAALKKFSVTLKKTVASSKELSKGFKDAAKAINGMNKELKTTGTLLKKMSKDLNNLAKIASKLPKTTAANAKQIAKVAKETAKATTALKSTSKQSKRVTQNFRNQAAAAAQVSSGLKGGLALLFRYGPAAALAATALGSLFIGVRAFKELVSSGNEAEAALTGLQSVARATGQDLDKTTDAAKQLVDDGLLTLAEASSSIKNLLATGMNLDQAIDSIHVYRDAAIFGRQATLGFGESIVSATEGLKNDNSVKSDNAGITENISIGIKRYAKEIGKSVVELTKAERAQAKVNALMREGELHAGNFEKGLDTYAGVMGKVTSRTQTFKDTLGLLFVKSPAVTTFLKSFAEGILKLQDFITKNQKAISLFIKNAVVRLVKALTIAAKTVKFLSISFRALQGVILDVGRGMFLVIKAIDTFAKKTQVVREAAKLMGQIMGSGAEKATNELRLRRLQEETSKAGKATQKYKDEVEALEAQINSTADMTSTAFGMTADEFTAAADEMEARSASMLEPLEEHTETAINSLSQLATDIEALADKKINIEVELKKKTSSEAGGGGGAGSGPAKGFENLGKEFGPGNKEGIKTFESIQAQATQKFLAAVGQFASAVLGFIRNTSDQEAVDAATAAFAEADKALQDSQSSYESFTKSIASNEEKLADLRRKRSNQEVIDTDKQNTRAKKSAETLAKLQADKAKIQADAEIAAAGLQPGFAPTDEVERKKFAFEEAANKEALIKLEKTKQERLAAINKRIAEAEKEIGGPTVSEDISEKEQALREKELVDLIKTEKELKKQAAEDAIDSEKKLKDKSAKLEKTERDKANKEAARGVITGLGTAAANTFLPGLGEAVGPILGALTQGPEAVEEQFTGMIEAIPDVILAIAEALPVLIEVLVEKSPDIAFAIVKGMITIISKSAERLVEVFTKKFQEIGEIVEGIFSSGLGEIFSGFENPFEGIPNPFDNWDIPTPTGLFDGINTGLTDLVNGFDSFGEAVKSISSVFDNFKFPSVGGGGGGGTLGNVTKSLGFATGGIVTGPGNRDTVPATLTPGELVVDRTTGPRLNKFIDEAESGTGSSKLDTSTIEILLSQLLQASEKEKTVSTTVEINQEVFADIMLRLNQDNARTE